MKQHYDKLPPYIGIIYLVMSEIYNNQNEPDKAKYYKDTGNTLCKSISYDGEAALQIYMKNIASMKINNTTKPSQTPALAYGENLSERELDILRLLSSGLTNQEIAEKLYITVNTTQWHLSHIYSKLGIKNRTQAIIRAKELGLI